MSAKRKPSSTYYHLTPGDRVLIFRIVLISSILLGLTLTITHVLLAGLAAESTGLLNALRTAVGLFVFWLFVTAAVRSLDRLHPVTPFTWLIFTGVATAVVGVLVFLLAIRVYALIWPGPGALPRYAIIGFYALAGLFASLFSLIHLKVKDRMWGNVLEFGLLILTAVLFFWLTK